jgi:hypothetical protein
MAANYGGWKMWGSKFVSRIHFSYEQQLGSNAFSQELNLKVFFAEYGYEGIVHLAF